MRKFWKKGFTFLLSTLLTVSLIGCGSSADGTGSTAGGSGSAGIVNIGVTGSLVSFNPFVMDMSEMNHYSSGLMFLPLVELDQNLNFVPMLADSITTEDNLTFTVHIDDAATGLMEHRLRRLMWNIPCGVCAARWLPIRI